jgi:hypothetical protein
MSDWRNRPDMDVQTLQWLALTLRATGRTKQASEIGRLALATPGAAQQFPIFKLWLAQDEAFAGNTQNALDHFKEVDITGWDDDALALYYLVRGVIRAQKADGPYRKEAFAAARDRVRRVFRKNPVFKRDVYLRREYRRCLVRMAKDSGKWTQVFGATWRSADSWLFLLPLLLIPGLQLFLPCYLYRLCTHRKGVRK